MKLGNKLQSRQIYKKNHGCVDVGRTTTFCMTTTSSMSHNHVVPSCTTKFLSVWTHLKIFIIALAAFFIFFSGGGRGRIHNSYNKSRFGKTVCNVIVVSPTKVFQLNLSSNLYLVILTNGANNEGSLVKMTNDASNAENLFKIANGASNCWNLAYASNGWNLAYDNNGWDLAYASNGWNLAYASNGWNLAHARVMAGIWHM